MFDILGAEVAGHALDYYVGHMRTRYKRCGVALEVSPGLFDIGSILRMQHLAVSESMSVCLGKLREEDWINGQGSLLKPTSARLRSNFLFLITALRHIRSA